MDLTADYLSAQLPAPQRLAGVAVQPFCLGHAILLQRLRSPLLPQAVQPPGKADALLALWVCSRPATQAMAQIHGWRARCWLKFMGWRLRWVETTALVAVLRDHIVRGGIGPRVHVKHETQGKPGTPLELSLLLHQMRVLGRDEATALNTPLRKVKWWFSGQHEIEGNCTIVSEEQISDWWTSWHKNFPGQMPITREMFTEIKRRKQQREGGTHG